MRVRPARYLMSRRVVVLGLALVAVVGVSALLVSQKPRELAASPAQHTNPDKSAVPIAPASPDLTAPASAKSALLAKPTAAVAPEASNAPSAAEIKKHFIATSKPPYTKVDIYDVDLMVQNGIPRSEITKYGALIKPVHGGEKAYGYPDGDKSAKVEFRNPMPRIQLTKRITYYTFCSEQPEDVEMELRYVLLK